MFFSLAAASCGPVAHPRTAVEWRAKAGWECSQLAHEPMAMCVFEAPMCTCVVENWDGVTRTLTRVLRFNACRRLHLEK